MNHTKEPLRTVFDFDSAFPQQVRIVQNVGQGHIIQATVYQRELAQPLVDAYNACAGINPEAVPKLLEVLKAITLAAYIDCPRNEAWKNLIETCKDAIALAEKEAK